MRYPSYDDEFEMQIEAMREDYYAAQMDRCANCGSKDVSCSAGCEAYCGPCWQEREAEKKARRTPKP